MDTVRTFDDAVATARQAGKRKLRWPVAKTVVVTGDDGVAAAIEDLRDLCEARANSRSVEVVRDRWERIGWRAEPVMRGIGPSFGKEGPKVKALIEQADGNLLKAALEERGEATVGEGEDVYTLTAAHVTFEENLPEEVYAAPMNSTATVYVDVALDDALESEGYAREVIRRLQEMRRQLDLRVEDYIEVDVGVGDGRVAGLLSGEWQDFIMQEVRASSLALHGPGGEAALITADLEKEWDVEAITMVMAVSRAPDQ
jgi:isoleucyl-tRNA synthetase